MPVVWHQCVHGKLVQHPGGPLLRKGEEHRSTGQSANLPPEVAAMCHPHKVGIGSARTGWSGYPWLKNGGGLLLRPHLLGETWYWLAARVCGFPEEPGRPASRLFTQMNYVAAPLIDLAQSGELTLPGLWKALQAEPMTELSYDLPGFKLAPAESFDLPVNWLVRARDWLTQLFTGRAVLELSPRQDPQEFFDLACVVLASLPAAVCWRLPLGVAVCEVTSDLALGLGWRFPVGPAPGQAAASKADDVDVATYFNWLEKTCRGVKDYGTLHRRVNEQLRSLAKWDALPLTPELNWTAAMLSALRAARSRWCLLSLGEWCDASSAKEFPTLELLEGDREEAVKCVVEAMPGSVAALSYMADESWATAWRAVARCADLPLAKSLCAFLGFGSGLAGHLDPLISLELPEDVCKRGEGALVEELASAVLPDAVRSWIPLLRACGRASAPQWLKALLTGHKSIVLWTACLAELQQRGSCLNAWEKCPELAALLAVLDGKHPRPQDFLRLTKLLPPKRSVVIPAPAELCRRCWGFGLYQEALFLNAALEQNGLPAGLANELQWEQFQKTGESDALVAKATEWGKEFVWPPSLFRLVLVWGDRLPTTLREKTASQLVSMIGANLTSIFLGTSLREPPVGSRENEALRNLNEALERSARCGEGKLVGRLLEHCLELREPDPITEVLANWAARSPRTSLAPFPVLLFFRDLVQKEITTVPDLTAVAASLLYRLYQTQNIDGLIFWDKLLTPSDETERSVGQLRAFLAVASTSVELPDSDSGLFAGCLRTYLQQREERTFWWEQLRRIQNIKEGWRLLHDAGVSRLYSAEKKVVLALPDQLAVRYILAGLPLSDDLRQNIVTRDLGGGDSGQAGWSPSPAFRQELDSVPKDTRLKEAQHMFAHLANNIQGKSARLFAIWLFVNFVGILGHLRTQGLILLDCEEVLQGLCPSLFSPLVKTVKSLAGETDPLRDPWLQLITRIRERTGISKTVLQSSFKNWWSATTTSL